ncbi:MAG: hypothetical protein ABSD20_06735 [Terriglobales bacterium]
MFLLLFLMACGKASSNGGGNSTSTYTLTVSISGNGSGSVSSNTGGIKCPGVCSAVYPSATAVTLTQTANPGSSSVGWSGAGCAGAGLSCSLTVSDNTNIAAAFSTTVSAMAWYLELSTSCSSTANAALWDENLNVQYLDPATNQPFVLVPGVVTTTRPFHCQIGDQICFGADTTENSNGGLYWGVGVNNQYPGDTSKYCYPCSGTSIGNEAEPFTLDSGPSC